MGSFVGNLITKKKKKKLTKAMAAESQLQVDSALEQAKLSQEANDVLLTKANVQMVTDRVQAARESRIARASVVANAANAGGKVSSAAMSAADIITTQFTSGIGLQNVFAGFSSRLSTLNQDIADEQTEIISSQGRQAALGAQLQLQQQKAEFYGSAVDMGINIASMVAAPFTGGASLAFLQGSKGSSGGGIFNSMSSSFSSGSSLFKSFSATANDNNVFRRK